MRSKARSSTLRTTIGFETLSYKGFSVLVEAEEVAVIRNDLYNNAGVGALNNGVRDRPVVADPDSTEINQLYLKIQRGQTTFRLGRSEITLGDHRFVGNVGWRQNHQSFDAFTLSNRSLNRVACAYYDGDRKVRLCPECLERMRREPGAGEILLAEGPARPPEVAHTPFGAAVPDPGARWQGVPPRTLSGD